MKNKNKRRVHIWTEQEIKILIDNYPTKGLKECAKILNLKDAQIRDKASRLKLKQDRTSDFFKDWQSRDAKSKIGKKRPEHSIIIKKLHSENKLYKFTETSIEKSIRLKEWYRTHEHPRGAKGIIHSKETRKILSEKSKKAWDNKTEEQMIKVRALASINGRKTTMNRSNASWKSGWRVVGGKNNYYRSRWEANYARYLQYLKENNEIKSWEHEPYIFKFKDDNNGCLSYLPDFKVINNDDSEVYHEVKGWEDKRSKTISYMMKKYYPYIKIITINTKPYNEIKNEFCNIIKDWEP